MMADKKFSTPQELEFYFFVKRMADTVTKLGDKVLCWDEATDADLSAGKTIVFLQAKQAGYTGSRPEELPGSAFVQIKPMYLICTG